MFKQAFPEFTAMRCHCIDNYPAAWDAVCGLNISTGMRTLAMWWAVEIPPDATVDWAARMIRLAMS